MRFLGSERRVLGCLAVCLALGCSGDKKVATSSAPGDGDGVVEHPAKGRDAGASKADAGAHKDGSAPSAPSSGGTSAPGSSGTGPSASAPKELLTIDECGDGNAAGLSAADVAKLQAGGKGAALSYLYPYDGTVFPRGFKAPLYMWKGSTAKAVYLKIRAQYFSYDGCLKPSAAGQVQLPQQVWEAIGAQTMGPSTPYKVELSTLDGSGVAGPVSQTIVVAQATLKGSIYYNSYDSKLGGAAGGGGFGIGGGSGTVIRITPGKDAEFFERMGTCTGCHAVSANGERLIAKEIGGGGGGFFGGGGGGTDGQVYNLMPNSAANVAPARAAAGAAFVGLSPDGKVYLTTAVQNNLGPNMGAGGGRGVAMATLYETDTGTAVTGTGIPGSASMPTFSADGTLLTFTDLAKGGKGLTLMDFDAKARKASHARALYTSPDSFTGWPFLLPDNDGVIFTLTESHDYSGGGAYINGMTQVGPASDLAIADATSGKGVILARAMGFDTPEDAKSDKTYLPFGAEELHHHYYPTVSPVAAGGYFWVFFDSIRHYGNNGMHRSLWATAVRVQRNQGEFTSADGPYSEDLSAPAFYIPGQELEGANHRAFTALDPCRADGQSCESGVDCCSGFCTDGVCGPPTGCSETNEKCNTDADCCVETDSCIGGFCGTVVM